MPDHLNSIKIIIIPNFSLMTFRSSKLPTQTKADRDAKFHVALYYKSDIQMTI